MSMLKVSSGKPVRIAAALGVAAAAVVSLATSSSAAASYKVSPATGPTASTTTVLTVTGTGFKSAAGVTQVGVVDFNTTCPAAAAGTAATTKSVVSAT